MKIAIIGINFAPEMTGCGPYTADLADELHKLGHEVTVFTGLPHYPQWQVPEEFRGQIRRSDVSRGYEVIRLWHYVPKHYSSPKRIIYEITFALHTLLRVLNKKFDTVVVVSPSLLSLLAGIWIKRKGAKLKVLVQDLITPAVKLGKGNSKKLLGNIVSWLETLLLNSADSLGVISETFPESIMKMGVKENLIRVTENYSLVDFSGLEHTTERKRWGWQSDKTIVMYTGSFGIKQDLGNLLNAARILQHLESEIKLVLVGDGSQRSFLQLQAKNLLNVEFIDLVPIDSYGSLLSSADVLIMHEGTIGEKMSLPSKLESYLASGRPIFSVCSNQSSTHAQITKYSIASCDAGSPELLAKSLISFVGNLKHQRIEDLSKNTRYQRVNWALD